MSLTIVCADQEEPELILPLVMPSQTNIPQAAASVRNLVGAGNPFFIFSNFPAEWVFAPNGLGWDPQTARVCSVNVAENEVSISAMLDDSSLQQFPNGKVFLA